MLTGRDKKIIMAALIILLATQTIIFACIPRDTDNTIINMVVKNGTSLYSIADRLKGDDLIYSSHLFVLCSMLYSGKLMAGEYALKRDMSTIEIVRKMARGERNIYTLKIVEGHNVFNVADAVDRSKIMENGAFFALAKNHGYLRKIGIMADSIEGYLAPDTYHYSKEIEVEDFIEKIVQRGFKFFAKEDIKKRMEEMGFDMHKTLTLASMIEKEARLKDEKPLISAVFHNRLNKGMPLDCDPTVIYGTGVFDGPITRSHLNSYTPYNTYTFKGLPKGPICNPDKNSIIAALYPAQVDYLYFVSKNDGTHIFSKDMKEHNRFVNMYQRGKNTKK
ncbi:MAG TPA: endolytic transglycosylase MltG [Syntrophorhabdaceae bacterium]|nr:endolytic transglycosylase MltG [Syntrophorhabdaceae bacterium]HQM80301.1 endolytic transglycosylase MltG [Syntrophorhabdaceae bacterium]